MEHLKKIPIIGVIPLVDSEKSSYWMLPGYMKAVELAGAAPLMLPLTTDKDLLELFFNQCDGFLFTGGQDVDTKLYETENANLCGEISTERDQMEDYILNRCLAEDKAVLGICRGIQIINVLLGGTLYVDLPTELGSVHAQPKPYNAPYHNVEILADAPLGELLQVSELKVNSCHHQGVKSLSEQLLPMAIADDGLIEAAYMPNKNFIQAVQWHPECLYDLETSEMKIFQNFVNHCK